MIFTDIFMYAFAIDHFVHFILHSDPLYYYFSLTFLGGGGDIALHLVVFFFYQIDVHKFRSSLFKLYCSKDLFPFYFCLMDYCALKKIIISMKKFAVLMCFYIRFKIKFGTKL